MPCSGYYRPEGLWSCHTSQMISSSLVSYLQDLKRIITLAGEPSIPIKHEKTCLPSTLIAVHGIELDTVKWEAQLPSDQVQKLQSSIGDIGKCRSVTLRQLQSVIGLLNFACRVISPGRAFLSLLINLTIGISRPGHHIMGLLHFLFQWRNYDHKQ